MKRTERYIFVSMRGQYEPGAQWLNFERIRSGKPATGRGHWLRFTMTWQSAARARVREEFMRLEPKPVNVAQTNPIVRLVGCDDDDKY